MSKIVSAIMGLGVVITTYVSYNVTNYVNACRDCSRSIALANHYADVISKQKEFVGDQDDNNFSAEKSKDSIEKELGVTGVMLGVQKIGFAKNLERLEGTRWYNVALGRYEVYGNYHPNGVIK